MVAGRNTDPKPGQWHKRVVAAGVSELCMAGKNTDPRPGQWHKRVVAAGVSEFCMAKMAVAHSLCIAR